MKRKLLFKGHCRFFVFVIFLPRSAQRAGQVRERLDNLTEPQPAAAIRQAFSPRGRGCQAAARAGERSGCTRQPAFRMPRPHRHPKHSRIEMQLQKPVPRADRRQVDRPSDGAYDSNLLDREHGIEQPAQSVRSPLFIGWGSYRGHRPRVSRLQQPRRAVVWTGVFPAQPCRARWRAQARRRIEGAGRLSKLRCV